ncbi:MULTISPECIES: monovalent cation/H+ antiporter complex subunit F [unclassified Thioalkalivibrio]|uniref:monovalent cation/H+ antiporter complex subunit F n=1 Tax=unclassified Thioalkalivibrio TaxID=2621013 RepID=UPI00037BF752|nr:MULTISPECIES: monovalent cation/H+ antiporter complex subunit F [unclassified Thioalkalivibrio]
MNLLLVTAAGFLLLTILFGLIRVLRGPGSGDRMLTAQLFGTSGVGILLLLGFALDQPALVDVALVFALLAVVAAVAFVRQHGLPEPAGTPMHENPVEEDPHDPGHNPGYNPTEKTHDR